MMIRIVLLLAVSFVLPTVCAYGQTIADVMKKLNDIDTKVTNIGDQVTKNEQRTNKLEADLTSLTKQVSDLATRLNEFDERQRQVLVASSAGDILNIRGQMQKPPFREAFDSAVHEVIRDKTGAFTITNKMPTYQRILVNRVEYGLRPNESRTIWLTPGTVHTELPNEETKTWMVGPPNYEQGIDIVPARHTVAYRGGSNGGNTTTVNYQSAAVTHTYYAPPTYVTRYPFYYDPYPIVWNSLPWQYWYYPSL